MEKADIAVTFHEPPDDLARYFTTFYYVECRTLVDDSVVDSLHPEWAGIRMFAGGYPDCQIDGKERVSGSDLMITGPSSHSLQFTTRDTRMWGVGLLPLGWATFVNQPADAFANTVRDGRKSPEFGQFTDLADRVLADDGQEHKQLASIIDFFRDPGFRAGKEDPRIGAIHAALIEPELPNVSGLADRCGLNQRTLERLCRKHFGFPPKLLLRRQRFMRSIAQFMLDPSMGWIGALDSLYFDQSHFVRDCQDFLGMSPSEYAATDHPVIAGFMRERMRAHGSAVQTLDDPGNN